MGSQNVTDSTYNLKKNIKRGLHWVDLMARLEGPVVASVNAVFLSDWYSETDEILTDEIDLFGVKSGPGDLDCQIIPSGPGFEFENNLRLFLGLIYYAQRKIIIVSPYFVPDEALLNAITTACHRGLHVELFVSEEGDQAIVYHAQRSYYEVLLRAGVKIWMYRKPYILHSKSMTIDDEARASSGRATWTCARSVSTWRSRCSCAARSSSARCAMSRRTTARSAASSRSRSGRSSRCARRCSTTSPDSRRRCSRADAPP